MECKRRMNCWHLPPEPQFKWLEMGSFFSWSSAVFRSKRETCVSVPLFQMDVLLNELMEIPVKTEGTIWSPSNKGIRFFLTLYQVHLYWTHYYVISVYGTTEENPFLQNPFWPKRRGIQTFPAVEGIPSGLNGRFTSCFKFSLQEKWNMLRNLGRKTKLTALIFLVLLWKTWIFTFVANTETGTSDIRFLLGFKFHFQKSHFIPLNPSNLISLEPKSSFCHFQQYFYFIFVSFP